MSETETKMETCSVQDERMEDRRMEPATVVKSLSDPIEETEEFLKESEACVKLFKKWNEVEQVTFVENLLSRMCHYQHGQVNTYLKPMLQRDFISALPDCLNHLFLVMEQEISGLNRRIQLLEEDLERSEERLQTATEKLEEATKAADESERVRRTVENKLFAGDERLEDIESELRLAKQAATEWENRYEEAARKLTVMEKDLESFEDRAETAERKVRDLEDQSHTLTNNLRSLELCEEKASQREDSYEETIRDLTQRLKDHESRSETSEREVVRLQKLLDRVEAELEDQRQVNSNLQEEMDQCIGDLQNL